MGVSWSLISPLLSALGPCEHLDSSSPLSKLQLGLGVPHNVGWKHEESITRVSPRVASEELLRKKRSL